MTYTAIYLTMMIIKNILSLYNIDFVTHTPTFIIILYRYRHIRLHYQLLFTYSFFIELMLIR